MIIGKAITAGGSGGIPCTLTVTTAEGALVEATLGSKKVSATAGADGTAILILEKEGLWTISATLDGETKSTEVLVEHNVEESLTFFPEEPSAYNQLALITSSQTWTAPENGWFQIELQGGSGNGGATAYQMLGYSQCQYGTGGGGGGGACAISRVKMNKGDTVVFTKGAIIGRDCSAIINSSLETYSQLKATSGANGTAGAKGSGATYTPGTGGAGGKASGGNYANRNGGAGENGTFVADQMGKEIVGGTGGAAGYSGGTVGGAGGTGTAKAGYTTISGSNGSLGFIKIYRGNTNLA